MHALAARLEGRPAASKLARAVFVVASGWTALAAWFIGGMECDESCDIEARGGAGWSESAGAPQWAEIGAMGTAILLLAGLAVVLTSRGHGRAAVVVVCLHAVASVRLGLLLAGGDWWIWVLLTPAMGLVMALGTPMQPAGQATARVIGALPAVVWAAGALLLGWAIQWLVGNAVTAEARLELAGFGMNAVEPIRFWSLLTAALCAAVLIAGAVHVLTKRPSLTVLWLGGVGGAVAALAVALYSASLLP